MSPTGWHPAGRWARAKSGSRTLLQDEQATVGAVARQVGYQSEVAFAAAFKREVGTSPGACRRAAAH